MQRMQRLHSFSSHLHQSLFRKSASPLSPNGVLYASVFLSPSYLLAFLPLLVFIPLEHFTASTRACQLQTVVTASAPTTWQRQRNRLRRVTRRRKKQREGSRRKFQLHVETMWGKTGMQCVVYLDIKMLRVGNGNKLGTNMTVIWL